jgi:hypothetical protein
MMTFLRDRLCPNCLAKLDSFTGNRPPAKGDVGVCLYCAAPTIFEDESNERLMTEAELVELSKNDPECYDDLINICEKILPRIKEHAEKN